MANPSAAPQKAPRFAVASHACLLDVVSIIIGELTQVGSGVQILTPDHPRDTALRRQGYESGKPVVIGANVWIGAGALILPGVTIGDALSSALAIC